MANRVEGLTMSPKKLLFTIRESCLILNMGRSSLYRLVKAGRIKSVRIGNRGVRISIHELEQFSLVERSLDAE